MSLIRISIGIVLVILYIVFGALIYTVCEEANNRSMRLKFVNDLRQFHNRFNLSSKICFIFILNNK